MGAKMTKTKRIIMLVMSVGHISKNGTVRYLAKIGAPKEQVVVVLPKQYQEFERGYAEQGYSTHIYDEQKYIPHIDFFGFRPRNCGGVGRQGIAEATEKFGGEDTICIQVDDDTAGFCVRKTEDSGKIKASAIRRWEDFCELFRAFDRFYDKAKCEVCCATGASVPSAKKNFCGQKIFNNFIMRKGNRLNFNGFESITSDDYRFNIVHQLNDRTPMLQSVKASITFTQHQGDRKDGNAVIYNGDFSWKKSFALRMMCPWAAEQRIKFLQGESHPTFLENIKASRLYPPILLSEKDGTITGIGFGKGRL